MELFKERLVEMLSWIVFIAIAFAVVGIPLYLFNTFFSVAFGVFALLFIAIATLAIVYSFIDWLVIEPIKSARKKRESFK